jgi:hypothetical protein
MRVVDEHPAGHRFLRALQEINCRRAGEENGRLILTVLEAEEFGITKNRYKPAWMLLQKLGLVAVDHHGGSTKRENARRPHLFRLTYLPTWRDGRRIEATHDWRGLSEGDLADLKRLPAKPPKRKFAVIEGGKDDV